MRSEKEWVDHPEGKPKSSIRPHLQLIVTPAAAPPDTPTEKAVKSISERTEIATIIIAQVILILGLFMASMFVG